MAAADDICQVMSRIRQRWVTSLGRRACGAVVTLGVLAAAGCGDDGTAADNEVSLDGPVAEGASGAAGRDDGADDGSGVDGVHLESGDSPDDVRVRISDLLNRYDQVVGDILVDPSVVNTSDDELVAEFTDLFEPGSDYVAGLLGVWADWADRGQRTLPYSDNYPSLQSELSGAVEAVAPDEVTFSFCVTRRNQVVGPEGEPLLPSLPRVEHPGVGSVVHTDDGWRLRDLNIDDFVNTCGGQE